MYAQNTVKPSAQFAEVTRITPRQRPVEEAFVNARNVKPVESVPDSRHPGYDYVQPYNAQKHAPPSSPRDNNYDYPRSPKGDNSTLQNDPHYRLPPPSRTDGYSVPTSYRDKSSPRQEYEDEYPPYKLPKELSYPVRNGHDPTNQGYIYDY